MKKILLIGLLFPLLVTAQKKTVSKTKAKVVAAEKEAGGFTINGEVTGFADGTKLALLNGTSGHLPKGRCKAYQVR